MRLAGIIACLSVRVVFFFRPENACAKYGTRVVFFLSLFILPFPLLPLKLCR